MKIASSTVTMASEHHETTYAYKEQVSIDRRASLDAPAAILNLSKESKGMGYIDAVKEYEAKEKHENAKRQQENQSRFADEIARRLEAAKNQNQIRVPDDLDMKIKMLRRILANLRGEKFEEEDTKYDNSRVGDLRSTSYKNATSVNISLTEAVSLNIGSLQIGTNSMGTTWQNITATSTYYSEVESTTFASRGMAVTQDGRNIDFGIEVSMSRGFSARFDSLSVKEYLVTDPLIINLDSNVTSVSDQKFFFDLDSDGQKEEVSFAGKGSGFLALDKDGNGRIDDGSELFGTKSGDGFKDLAQYDDDGNGWIDENDAIFKQLKVWTKDENGKDYLIDLLKADVGAIYLGNTDTQYSLKDDSHNLNAEIKKTGIYLKESSGAAGTIAHVDLAV